MRQPVVFMSKGFFIAFCKELSKPYDKITLSKKILIYIEDLIFYKATVFINIGETDIRNIYEMEAKDAGDENEQLFCVYLKKLMSQNKLKSCKNEIEVFREKNRGAEFLLLQHKPQFIFLSDHKDFCERVANEFGVICISKEMELHETNSRVEIRTIEARKNIDIDYCTNYLPKCNSLIIEDAYLLNQTREFIVDLIRCFYLKRGAIGIFYLTLILKNDKGKDLTALENKLKEQFPSIHIEIYIRAHGNMHDRNIYSNTFWLTCDYGFQEKYPDATKWSIFPIGNYFSQYHSRKESSVRFIKNEKQHSENYLVN